jgi:hypothetical protein
MGEHFVEIVIACLGVWFSYMGGYKVGMLTEKMQNRNTATSLTAKACLDVIESILRREEQAVHAKIAELKGKM